MNFAKRLSLLAALSAASSALAVDVANVQMAQNTVNCNVTITYELSGPAVVTLDIMTNATPNAATGWASIGGQYISSAKGAVWRKVTSADANGGTYTITWQPADSWLDANGDGFRVADGCAKAVVSAWPLDNPPDYMVVDISSAAQPDTQRYYPAVDFLPGGLLENGDYRSTSLVMRKVPAAGVEWTMGSVAELGRITAKEATHKVRLDANYYLGVFPVTQSQWALVQPSRPNPSCFQYEADKKWRPVEYVCYNELRLSNSETSGAATYYWPNPPHANSFIGRLRTKTGIAFDLPSEAQWEFACRAGNGEGKWGDGSDYLSNTTDANLAALACYGRANIQNQVTEGNTTWAAADGGTMPVGTHAPNAWGFYDMHGNVLEMCLDWFEADASAHGGAVNIDPSVPKKNLSGADGAYRVCRGGTYRHNASACRSAYRTELIANGRYNIYGLRVACPASAE